MISYFNERLKVVNKELERSNNTTTSEYLERQRTKLLEAMCYRCCNEFGDSSGLCKQCKKDR
jgi:hypothetical protein